MSVRLFHIYKEGETDYCIPISSSQKYGSMNKLEVSYISCGDEIHEWSIEKDSSPWDSEKIVNASTLNTNMLFDLFKFIFKKDLK